MSYSQTSSVALLSECGTNSLQCLGFAFSFDILESAAALKAENVSLQAIYDTLVVNEAGSANARSPDVYRQFSATCNEFIQIHHLTSHGRVTADIYEKWGARRFECPCLGVYRGSWNDEANVDCSTFGPVVLAGDGFFSASHMKAGKTTGQQYGLPLTGAEYFQKLSSALSSTKDNDAICRTKFFAVETRNGFDKKNDINGIFATACSHGIVNAVFDVDHGEGFKYMDSAMDYLYNNYNIHGSEVILSYDVNCRYLAHVKKHHRTESTISMLPVLHAFCHGADCQSRFAQYFVMGVGSMDGEWIERVWSSLTKCIGRTQRATHGNRQLQIVTTFEVDGFKKVNQFVKLVTQRADKAVAGIASLREKLPSEWAPRDYKGVIENNVARRRAELQNRFQKKSVGTKDEKLSSLIKSCEAAAANIKKVEAKLGRVLGTGGTTQASILKKGLKKKMSSLRRLVSLYNTISEPTKEDYNIPLEDVNFEDHEESSDDEDELDTGTADQSVAHGASASEIDLGQELGATCDLSLPLRLELKDAFARVRSSPQSADYEENLLETYGRSLFRRLGPVEVLLVLLPSKAAFLACAEVSFAPRS
ncbi:hypothetical protein DFJ73DRAFT_923153 [Zopfochytrium polystomum]|nr:hypothetical protein DFJ73DRAFT_923153 [Zopfochytrium polystomum]